MEKVKESLQTCAQLANQIELSVINPDMKDSLGAQFSDTNGSVVVRYEEDSVNGPSKKLIVWGSPFSEITGTGDQKRVFSVLPDSQVYVEEKGKIDQRGASSEEYEIVGFLLQSMVEGQQERERMRQRVIGAVL
jgi:hypothetical protein